MTDGNNALLTFSIGPVHSFIAQARRIADVWAGSHLLSDLIRHAVVALHESGGIMVFPFLPRGPSASSLPDGLPNRFVCRVPLDAAAATAAAMDRAVSHRWTDLVQNAKERLNRYQITFSEHFDAQTEGLIEISWSFVPEQADYATASVEGARRFAASRVCRPFRQMLQSGTNCAVCGQRTAIPDGISTNINAKWKHAEELSKRTTEAGYFRYDQARLCLVCATKRLYPLAAGQAKAAQFDSFHMFEPADDDESPIAPYFAVVALDGDHMGRILGWDSTNLSGRAEQFHQRVSQILTDFADALRSPASPALNLRAIDYELPEGRTKPQLIYAGGEDVLLVCDPRDAVPLADRISLSYERRFKDPKEGVTSFVSNAEAFTMSAAIIFAHTKEPAGALLRDLEVLLKENAKRQMGRDAFAIRLQKRGGPPVDVAFKWNRDAATGKSDSVERVMAVVSDLGERHLGSTQLFAFADDARKLESTNFDTTQWTQWLQMRLGRGEKSATGADRLATALAPFFEKKEVEALRIARFLGVEMEP